MIFAKIDQKDGGELMIIEKLMRQADFTDVEKSIADYLLQNGYEVKNMSISDLAEEDLFFTGHHYPILQKTGSGRL